MYLGILKSRIFQELSLLIIHYLRGFSKRIVFFLNAGLYENVIIQFD